MKTQEELKSELFKQTLEVESAIVKLDKASLILGHWINEYVFSESPNPNKAANYSASIRPEENIGAEQSCKWFYEYGQIIGLVDIVSDYVFESRKLLEKAVYGEKIDKSA